jgi:hypothetical protein
MGLKKRFLLALSLGVAIPAACTSGSNNSSPPGTGNDVRAPRVESGLVLGNRRQLPARRQRRGRREQPGPRAGHRVSVNGELSQGLRLGRVVPMPDNGLTNDYGSGLGVRVVVPAPLGVLESRTGRGDPR